MHISDPDSLEPALLWSHLFTGLVFLALEEMRSSGVLCKARLLMEASPASRGSQQAAADAWAHDLALVAQELVSGMSGARQHVVTFEDLRLQASVAIPEAPRTLGSFWLEALLVRSSKVYWDGESSVELRPPRPYEAVARLARTIAGAPCPPLLKVTCYENPWEGCEFFYIVCGRYHGHALFCYLDTAIMSGSVLEWQGWSLSRRVGRQESSFVYYKNDFWRIGALGLGHDDANDARCAARAHLIAPPQRGWQFDDIDVEHLGYGFFHTYTPVVEKIIAEARASRLEPVCCSHSQGPAMIEVWVRLQRSLQLTTSSKAIENALEEEGYISYI